MFTLLLSIEFIMVIIIGGVFGLHGAILGAIFIVMVDPFLTLLKDDVPGYDRQSVVSSSAPACRPRAELQETAASDLLGAGPEGRDLRPDHHRCSSCSSRPASMAAGSR